jgi:hypothetical protein
MLPLKSTSEASPSTMKEGGFTAKELHRLLALRQRFAQHRDLFSEHELARLCFVRWLVQTGRIEAPNADTYRRHTVHKGRTP